MTTDARVYVGGVGQGVWRSDDGGDSWERKSLGMFFECDVRALAAHPHESEVLYAGTNEGIYRTDDGGEHWRRLESPMNELVIWCLLVLPNQPDTLFAGTRPPHLYRSTDAGQTWEQLNVPFAQECPNIIYNRVTTLRQDRANADWVWAGVEIDGPWLSRDGGENWSKFAEGLSSQDIHSLAIIPTNGGRTLVASTDNDLNISMDDGKTWQPQKMYERTPLPYYRGMAQRADDPDVIFLGNGDYPPGTTGAAWRSNDGGRNWDQMQLPGALNSTIWDFAVHPHDASRIYAYSIFGSVYRSTSGGDRWEKLDHQFGEIRALLWLPSATAHVVS